MSTVKVNTVDKRTGSTLTLGGCGTTVTLGAGATQSGFGRTGTVDWCTTAKTAPFTGVSGNGYFVNTTSGAVTVTLPATPSAGDIISIADYASTFQTNNLTICRNSSKINGVCGNSILNTEGQSITLVYVDGTRGWKNTMDSTSDVSGAPNYIIATGGTNNLLWRLQNSYFYFRWLFRCHKCWYSCWIKFSRIFSSGRWWRRW
jgi:hypothetical protein